MFKRLCLILPLLLGRGAAFAEAEKAPAKTTVKMYLFMVSGFSNPEFRQNSQCNRTQSGAGNDAA